MTYEEVVPEMWIPKEDEDSVEGFLVNIQKDIGENKSMLYMIETPDGVKNVWGSAILDSRMSLAKIGDKIRITYKGLGEKKGGHNPPKIFKLEIDREDKEE